MYYFDLVHCVLGEKCLLRIDIITLLAPLTTAGGAPDVEIITLGALSTGFGGCITSVAIGPVSDTPPLSLDSALRGFSVRQCTVQ